MVVDRDGTAKQIKVGRSLGMGLDEAAVAAVKTWRFQPSTKDGRRWLYKSMSRSISSSMA